MKSHFKVELTKVHCVVEQQDEWGDDEIRLLGFGVSLGGTVFAPGVMNLGTYKEGDVRSDGIFPMTVFEADLEDDVLGVAAYFWIIEKDWGEIDSSSEALKADFRSAYQEQALHLRGFGVPRTCVPLAAFYRALPSYVSRLTQATYDFWNNDDASQPREQYFHKEDPRNTLFRGERLVTISFKDFAIYNMTMVHTFEAEPLLGLG